MFELHAIQKHLAEEKLSGWLLFDFHGQNPLARTFLQLDPTLLISRRFFYWIPAHGQPIQIVHQIESHVLSHLPGTSMTYLSSLSLSQILQKILKGRIAMEYSPFGAIPYLSKVDGGTLEWIRSFGVEVVSSGNFLQYYTCRLDSEQLASHKKAAAFLDEAAEKTWKKIAQALKNNETITEYGVRLFLLSLFEAEGFVTDAKPICAVNAHSASPHFEPEEKNEAPIKQGDFILIDLWCKQKGKRTIYGDITRVAVAAQAPTPKQQAIFTIVRQAQQEAISYLKREFSLNHRVRGCDVDKVTRSVIEKSGYGEFFPHRTGHNIYTEDHGPGAHLDSLETNDERYLIPQTCFSIEPGIYLPGEFGIRLEHDVYLPSSTSLEITGGEQNQIKTLTF